MTDDPEALCLDDDTMQQPKVPETPFRLLDLPAEIRLQIYEDALVPDDNLVRSLKNARNIYGWQRATVNLLLSCRIIRDEAHNILFDKNCFMVRAEIYQDSWNMGEAAILISRTTKAKIKHLFVVVDAHNYYKSYNRDVDFGVFQDMTSLESIKVTFIQNSNARDFENTRLIGWMRQIIERIPAKCTVKVGSDTRSEREFTAECQTANRIADEDHIIEHCCNMTELAVHDVDFLDDVWDCEELVQGRLSGVKRDYPSRR